MKSTLTIDIDYLANLAHIYLEPTEKEIIQKDILKIIDFFSKLNEIDTTNVEVYYNSHLGETKFLTDLAKTEINVKDYIENNTKHEGMYIQIPSILKK
ncbi:MAG: Asp-tRNA(Asn)/Glu-tRNA(Gln) amidotransferase subunit GatC [bacterium]